jgi:hypothetical protein
MASMIIYGDSFSDPTFCNSTPDDMWFRHAWPADSVVVNRARMGNSSQAMFLEATHDAVTRSEPTRLVMALGPLGRLPRYQDGWYDQEQLTEHRPEDGNPATLADASARLNSLRWQDINTSVYSGLTDLFHPTLLWSTLFKDVLCLEALCHARGHELLVLHMSHMAQEYYDRHVLLAPLLTAVRQTKCYLHIEHSCSNVCHRAGILPHDHDEYGVLGHHGPEGQRHFGLYIRELSQQNT